MRSLLFFVAILLFWGKISAQEAILQQWDPALIDQANTAKNIDYYTENEKQIFLLMNLARLDGRLFASTFLDQYLKSTMMPGNSYVNSLIRTLNSLKALPVLNPAKDLYDIAKGHAIKSGQTGHVGHMDMNTRFEPVLGKVYFSMAENCSYGYDEAMDIVISLLIDDGIASLGHRKNILSKSYNYTGVSIQPHKDYRYNCVIDFGGDTY